MSNGCFVAGTDTEIGKTLVACALIHALRARGLRAIGMKPVAAGCDTQGVNEDVAALAAAGSFAVDARLANPYLFRDAIAPHIAAQREGVVIDLEHIARCHDALRRQADAVVVEGVGGLRVPLGERSDAADLAVRLGLPVVLVVGMRLGCINHALLSAEALAARDLPLAGWVANRIDPDMACFDENIAALESRLDAPLLGVLPHMAPPDPPRAAGLLRLPGFDA